MLNARKNTGAGELPNQVLIVEDDAVIGMMLEAALIDAGIGDVRLCSTTEQALAALRKRTPDALILDVHLADRDDGWAVAELVQTLGGGQPQIIFSTGTPQDIPAEIADLGAILEKPYDPEALIELLREPKQRGIISRLRGVLRAQ